MKNESANDNQFLMHPYRSNNGQTKELFSRSNLANEKLVTSTSENFTMTITY